MSIDQALNVDSAEVSARRTILRVAAGVAGSFVVAEGLGWDFTFLGPMFAAQFLLSSPAPPTLKQGVVQLVVVALAMAVNVALAYVFLSSPWCLIAAFLLLLFLTFYGQARGVPDAAIMILQIGAIATPTLAVSSTELADETVVNLWKAMLIALLTTWAAHAMFPDPRPTRGGPAPPARRADHPDALRFAVRNTLILAPMLAWYLLDASQVALVLLVTILMVIRQYDRAMGQRVALGMILGNVIGGFVASLAYNAIQLQPSFALLAVVCFLVSLIYAARIVAGGPFAPILTVAFSTFILLLGMGLSPLPGGSEEAFASRIVNVLLATAYAGMALVLLGGRGGARASEP
jgi:hypothetical protein